MPIRTIGINGLTRINMFDFFQGNSIKSSKDIEVKYRDTVDSFLWEDDNNVYLERISVNERGQGTGTQFMNELIEYANRSNKNIILEPDEDLGGDLDRLKEFYSRFGFLEDGDKMRYDFQEEISTANKNDWYKMSSLPDDLYYEDGEEFGFEAEELAKKYFNTLRGTECKLAVLNEKREVVAALFTDETNSESFSFDIVVRPDYQNRGIGKELVEEAISEFNYLKDVYGDDYYIDVHVINPVMRDILEKNYGFSVDKEFNEENLTMRYQKNQKNQVRLAKTLDRNFNLKSIVNRKVTIAMFDGSKDFWKKVASSEEKDAEGSVYNLDIQIELPETLQKIFSWFESEGLNALIVGGAVRDRFIGKEPKDIDIEVYGTNYEKLSKTLSQFGRVDVVGKSFGIIKITDSEGNDYDFSIPRRESKTGVGHRGFNVEFDESITPKEAAARRDFTMNALAYDPIKKQVHDYFGGVEDIKNKVLKATSPAFAEDPLRVLRGMQFAGRFGFSLDPETADISRDLMEEYSHLARERVSGEWMKMFTKSNHPGKSLEYLVASGWINLYPEIDAFINNDVQEDLLQEMNYVEYPQLKGKEIKQEPEWHPEGGVMIHTIYVLEAAAKIADEQGLSGDDRAVILMAGLCHDLGKATHTEIEDKNGVPRVTSKGHEAASVPLSEKFLQSIGIKNDLIKRVLPLVGNHMQHISYDSGSKKGNVRQIAERLFPATIKELELMIRSDMGGRPPLPGGLPEPAEKMIEDAKDEGVFEGKVTDLIMGRDIIDLVPSGQRMLIGEALKLVRQKQLEGSVKDSEGALIVAENYIKSKLLLINGSDVMSVSGLGGGPYIKGVLDAAWEEQKGGTFSNREGALEWLSQQFDPKEESKDEENLDENDPWYRVNKED